MVENQHFLLLKQHKITKLKYLCYHFGTYESCFKYKGSGVKWRQHLKLHKNITSTIVLDQNIDINLIREKGIFYSELWDIVVSDDFANLIKEDCSTSFSHINNSDLKFKCGELTRQRQKGKTMAERLGINDYVNPRKGKSMQEATGNINYKPWNKGKCMKELKGNDYIHPTSLPFKIIINNTDEIICNSEQDFFSKTKLHTIAIAKLKAQGSVIIKRQSNSKHNFKTGDKLQLIYIT